MTHVAGFPANVSALLDDAARRWPAGHVLNFFEDDVRLTFRQLRDQSVALAAALGRDGVGKGDRLAVVLPNLPAFPLLWLATARLGAVIVPINPRFTADEVRFVLDDVRPTRIVADESVLGVVRDAADGLVAPDDIACWTGGAHGHLVLRGATITPSTTVDEEPPWPQVSVDDVFGINYTSGTTGFPKGCLLTHRSWLTMGLVTAGVLPEPPRRVLSDAPWFYLDAPLELVLALVVGAEQYTARRTSLSRFTGWLADFDIDYAEVWEALGDRVLDEDAEARLRARSRPLHLSVFGLPPELHRNLEQRLNAQVREFFGMTEIGMGMVEPFDSDAYVGSGACGVAAQFRETRVVDPDTLTDVADGSEGELWCRGPGLFLGYHNRPEANADCFPGDGWFRTGDLVRRDDAGHHFLVGRIKDMIRRSHENIAAREVEQALAGIEGVDVAAVVPVPDAFRGEEVKAFLLLADGVTDLDLPPETIAAQASQRLASYKVPRYFEYVAELPYTASGKVAKRVLRERAAGSVAGYDRVEQKWT